MYTANDFSSSDFIPDPRSGLNTHQLLVKRPTTLLPDPTLMSWAGVKVYITYVVRTSGTDMDQWDTGIYVADLLEDMEITVYHIVGKKKFREPVTLKGTEGGGGEAYVQPPLEMELVGHTKRKRNRIRVIFDSYANGIVFKPRKVKPKKP